MATFSFCFFYLCINIFVGSLHAGGMDESGLVFRRYMATSVAMATLFFIELDAHMHVKLYHTLCFLRVFVLEFLAFRVLTDCRFRLVLNNCN